MNIFLVEDDEEYYEETIDFLEHDDHTVTHAKNLKDALEMISDFEKLGIRVAILDGYMPKEENDKGAGFHGPVIADEIKKKFPEVTIIAYTNVPVEYAKYGDIYVTKEYGAAEGGIGKIRREINNISKNKTPQT